MANTDARTASPKIKLELWEKLLLQTTREGRYFTFLTRLVEQSAEEIVIEIGVPWGQRGNAKHLPCAFAIRTR